MTMDAEKEVKALLWCWERLTWRERQAVLHLAQDLVPADAVEPPPSKAAIPPTRGMGICADCGEHAMCYARKGVSRCSACRRKLPFADTQTDPVEPSQGEGK
jgi:hypothetical protein